MVARGPLDTARNPSAAITSRYPAAREQVALADRLTTPSDAAVTTPDAAAPTGDRRRQGILQRNARAGELAAVRHALITHPDSNYDTDRRGRTALHHTADSGQPSLAIALIAACAAVNARDRDGYTLVDAAEYWEAPAPLRALDRLATRAVLHCHDGNRFVFSSVADPAAFVDVHRRLAAAVRRSSRTCALVRRTMGLARCTRHALSAVRRTPADCAAVALSQQPSCAPVAPNRISTPLVAAARAGPTTPTRTLSLLAPRRPQLALLHPPPTTLTKSALRRMPAPTTSSSTSSLIHRHPRPPIDATPGTRLPRSRSPFDASVSAPSPSSGPSLTSMALPCSPLGACAPPLLTVPPQLRPRPTPDPAAAAAATNPASRRIRRAFTCWPQLCYRPRRAPRPLRRAAPTLRPRLLPAVQRQPQPHRHRRTRATCSRSCAPSADAGGSDARFALWRASRPVRLQRVLVGRIPHVIESWTHVCYTMLDAMIALVALSLAMSAKSSCVATTYAISSACARTHGWYCVREVPLCAAVRIQVAGRNAIR